MEGMLMYDEAYNGWDTLQIMETGRLQPFLPDNNGRESGWHYWLVPFMAAFGARPFTLHFASSVTGILTVAAIYALGRELFDRRVGFWSACGLAILYMHVHLSHLGLRAIAQPLVGALGFMIFLRARRTNRQALWALSGVMFGLLSYTYFAARLWMVLAVGIMAWLWVTDRKIRRGLILCLLVMALVSLPQLLYATSHPDQSMFRVSTVAIESPGQLWQNVLLWGNAFFGKGDTNADLNMSMRPILDWMLALPLFAGIATTVFIARRRWGSIWIWGLALTAISASLFSGDAPHFLRAVGLTIPLGLILGLGADGLARMLRPRLGILASVLVFVMFGASAASSTRDFSRWLQHDSILTSMEIYVNGPAGWIKEQVPASDELAVYFTPFARFHPNVAFQAYSLAPRYAGGFATDRCLVISNKDTYYVTVPSFEMNFAERMAPWVNLSLVKEATELFNGQPLYRIYKSETKAFESHLSPVDEAPVYGEMLRIRHASIPRTVSPGEKLSIWLGFQAQTPVPIVASAFVHLQGDPSPYEGGTLWAQMDSWLCDPYPSTVWRSDETILQEFTLELPADLPPGEYEIAVGLHEAPTGPRLPLTAPASNPDAYYVIHRLQVTN